MSGDEGVMPFEVVQDATPAEVTPEPGKGALGTRRFRELHPHPDAELEAMRSGYRNEDVGKPCRVGVNVSQHLSHGRHGKTGIR